MSQSATTTPPEPNLAALLELLHRALRDRGTITLTMARPLPKPTQVEVTFDIDEIAFPADLMPEAFPEVLGYALVQTERGAPLKGDEGRENAITERETQRLLYGGPAPTRPHLVLVPDLTP